jgi:hypothetical protein
MSGTDEYILLINTYTHTYIHIQYNSVQYCWAADLEVAAVGQEAEAACPGLASEPTHPGGQVQRQNRDPHAGFYLGILVLDVANLVPDSIPHSRPHAQAEIRKPHFFEQGGVIRSKLSLKLSLSGH